MQITSLDLTAVDPLGVSLKHRSCAVPPSSSSFSPRIVVVIPLAFVLSPLALRCDTAPHS